MALLNITKTYSDGTTLFESDLDAIRSSIETFLNVTGINDDNIQDLGITASTKLVNGSISEGKLAANSVSDSKLRQSAGVSIIGRSINSTGNVADITASSNDTLLIRTSDSLSFGQLTTGMFPDFVVTESKLNGSSVSTNKIVNEAVTTAKIADEAITTAKLPDFAVTEAKLNGSAVTVNKIATGAVSEPKLAAGAVTTAKLGDASVTQAKLAASTIASPATAGNVLRSASATQFTTSTSFTAVTNLTGSLTTTGRPVVITLAPDDGGTTGFIGASSSSASASANFQIKRGSSVIAVTQVDSITTAIRVPPGSFFAIDNPSAGTYTYSVEFKGTASGDSALVQGCKLVAYEI